MKDFLLESKKKWQKREIKFINRRIILVNEFKDIEQKIFEFDKKITTENDLNQLDFFDKEKELLLGKKVTNRIKFQDLLREEKKFLNEKKQIFNDTIETSKQAIKSLDIQNKEIIDSSNYFNSKKLNQLEIENNYLTHENKKLQIQNKNLKKMLEVLTIEQKNLVQRFKEKQEKKERDNDFQK